MVLLKKSYSHIKIHFIILFTFRRSQIALDTTYWTVFNHITIWGSLVSYFALDYFYNYVIGGRYVGSLTGALTQATFWFTAVLTVSALFTNLFHLLYAVVHCNSFVKRCHNILALKCNAYYFKVKKCIV